MNEDLSFVARLIISLCLESSVLLVIMVIGRQGRLTQGSFIESLDNGVTRAKSELVCLNSSINSVTIPSVYSILTRDNNVTSIYLDGVEISKEDLLNYCYMKVYVTYNEESGVLVLERR